MDMDETTAAAQRDTEGCAAALLCCAAFAETLSALYFKPLTQGQIDALAEQDLAGLAGLNEEFDRGLNDVARYLRRRNTGTRQQLACDFTSAFVGTKTYEGKSAVPYESVFTSDEGLLCQRSFHEVTALYRREGFAKDDGLNIPEDHLSYLVEFAAVLMRRAVGELDGDAAAARHDLACARDLIDEHVLSWFDAFAERASLLLQTRFYRGVLKMTRGYLVFARDLADEVAAELSEEAAAA